MSKDTPFTLQGDPGRYFPDRAQRMEVGGWARIRCTVAPGDGALSDCVVVGEKPANFDFGRATLRLSRIMRAQTDAPSVVAGRPSYLKAAFAVPGTGGRTGEEPVKTATRAEIEAARPAGADAMGMASLSCLVPLTDNGPLSECAVLHEGPAGQGFGAAAIGLAQAGYSAKFEPLPEKVQVWLSGRYLKDMDARGVLGRSGNGTDVRIVPTVSAEALASLPKDNAYKLICGWTPDGRLQDCVVDPASAAALPDEAAAVLAFAPNLRLVRTVAFNINWGQ